MDLTARACCLYWLRSVANTKITKHELSEIISFNSSLSRITVTPNADPMNARLLETTFSDSQHFEWRKCRMLKWRKVRFIKIKNSEQLIFLVVNTPKRKNVEKREVGQKCNNRKDIFFHELFNTIYIIFLMATKRLFSAKKWIIIFFFNATHLILL